MGLVVQVDADDRGLVLVAARQHLPVVDPPLLAVLRGVPELTLRGGIGAMPVEDHREAVGLGAGDDGVHQLERSERDQSRLTAALIEFDAFAVRHSFEKGRRIALNPMPAIAARPSSSEIDHSPCGAQFEVSIPNHAAALIVNGAPAAVTIVDPLVESQPGSVDAADAGEAIAPRGDQRRARDEGRRAAEDATRGRPVRAQCGHVHPRGHRTGTTSPLEPTPRGPRFRSITRL